MASNKSIYSQNRKKENISERMQKAKQAKKFFENALKKKSLESKQARFGRKFVKGVSKGLKVRGGRGFIRVQSLTNPSQNEWSDLGLIAGSPFKSYQSRNVFPNSGRDRTLHPQEKAEIDATLQKVRLFGIPTSQLSVVDNKKKKIGDEKDGF